MTIRFSKAVAFLVSFLFIAPSFAEEAKQEDPAKTYQLLNLFSEVFEKVRSDYVEEKTDQEIIEAAIQGMLSSLDPHSSFLNADHFKDMQVQTKGQFGGLGIQVSMDPSGLIKVISPIDDTPAYKAGMKAGDLISHLDGEGVSGLTLSQAVDKMRGPVGADITMTVRRNGEKPFDVTITRAVIKVPSVRNRMEGDIGYIRITSFTEQTERGLKKAIDKFNKEKGDRLKGIVLDLRNNPGGLLDQAIAVSDAFLSRGEIVSTRSRRSEDIQRYNARPGDLADGLPVVVLINGGSASASEIVAGALQDHARALILGTRSFGKGSVQTILPLGVHGAMRLTTARYYTPSGHSIQGVGIDPDIKVEIAKIEKIGVGVGTREADLRGSLKNTDEDAKQRKDKADEERNGKKEDVKKQEDYQLSRALDLIEGISLYSEMPRNTEE
ncbi:Carboxy-terminal-processing protease [Candidatus Terasakiella magnetica]|uniref:Carboxy-terminal-processing protease n=1 Tax=Candidatus Terasakiella magnetica TaxID=1867952 RepID=A0A1C3REH2_9PROT|nr:S41 family peptidase [Candidatus Terasakiella magnetica]SCA55683.1 Carboxy-terminal-processing protease [Candidatus Terasakiella magnetica]